MVATLIIKPQSLSADGLDLPALLARIEKELPKALPEVQWKINDRERRAACRKAAGAVVVGKGC